MADLQTDSAAVQLPRQIDPPKFRAPGSRSVAAFVVSVLLGVGIGWGVYGNTTLTAGLHLAIPGAKPDGVAAVVLTPPTQLQSLGGLTGLMEQTRKRFGDTMGYRLVIYPTYAILDRPDPSDDRRVLSYDYRGGWGDPTSSAKAPPTGPSRSTWASSTSRRRSASCAAPRKPCASNRPTSKPRT